MSTPVVPTKGNLISLKKSYELSKVGFELMDKKRNILIKELMALIKKASEVQNKIDFTYNQAYKALQKANITLGICKEISETVPIDNLWAWKFLLSLSMKLKESISLSAYILPTLCSMKLTINLLK